MKKLCVFTLYDTKGASSKYRIIQFEEPLKNKFEIQSFHFWNNTYSTVYMKNKRKYALQIIATYIIALFKRIYQLNFVATKADIVFFQKTCIPKVKINFIKKLKNKGIKIVMDIDDAMYVYKNDQTDTIAAMCDLVICGNETLVEHYKQFCNNCVLIPTVENTTLFEPYYRDTFSSKKIGWIGSKTTVPNLELVVDAINRVVEKHPEVSFDIISDTALNFPNRIRNCRLVKWTEEGYIKDLSEFTIGIMPLEDNELNRGKCGFKLVQCLNMDKPVVASDVGVNHEIVGNCGYIAESTDEWVETMERLLFDDKAYSECVESIKEEFFPKYHYSIVVDELCRALDGLTS